MSVPCFQVDAFSDGPFTGNPAAVCLLSHEASPAWMQAVAAEMNLAETAFVSPMPLAASGRPARSPPGNCVGLLPRSKSNFAGTPHWRQPAPCMRAAPSATTNPSPLRPPAEHSPQLGSMPAATRSWSSTFPQCAAVVTQAPNGTERRVMPDFSPGHVGRTRMAEHPSLPRCAGDSTRRMAIGLEHAQEMRLLPRSAGSVDP